MNKSVSVKVRREGYNNFVGYVVVGNKINNSELGYTPPCETERLAYRQAVYSANMIDYTAKSGVKKKRMGVWDRLKKIIG